MNLKKTIVFVILIFITTSIFCEYGDVHWKEKYESAAFGGEIDEMEYYEKKGLVRLSREDYSKILHSCIHSGLHLSKKSHSYLIEKDIDINTTGLFSDSYLIKSVKNWSDYEFCKKLIEKGIDVNKKDIFTLTALDYVIKGNMQFKFYKLLIENGAEVSWRHMKLELINRKYRPDRLLYLYDHLENKSKSGLNELMEALLLKNDKYINDFIKKNKKIKPKKYTAEFYLALQNGNIEFVKYIMESGFDINQLRYDQDTPLMAAAKYGQIEIMKYLISQGADIYREIYRDKNAIRRAVENNQMGAVRFFFENKYYKNANDVFIDSYGYNSTAYEVALTENFEMLNYFIKKGLKLNDQNILAVFGAGLWKDDTNLCKYILSKCNNINIKDFNGEGFLKKSAFTGNLEMVKYLIKKGANVNLKNEYNSTALNTAIQFKYLDIAWYLIKHGANTNTYYFRDSEKKEISGSTLMQASLTYDIDLVEYIIKHGSDVNHSDYNRNTALHFVCRTGCLEIAELLVKNGAKINIWSKEGLTPLMEAIEFNNPHIVKFLVENGADYSGVAMDFAKRHDKETYKYFKSMSKKKK